MTPRPHRIRVSPDRTGDATEKITMSDGTVIVIDLDPDCGGRPPSASALFRRPDPRRFCSCPFDETQP
jgi:hypothetical protein